MLEDGYKNADTKEDSLAIQEALANLNRSESRNDSGSKKDDEKGIHISTKFGAENSGYKTVKEYDSIQKSLPEAQRDGWFTRTLQHKSLGLEERYRDNQAEFWQSLIGKFLHSLPYMLFVSLPLYALFLKLLYMRKKQFYYADHGLFLIHLYVFTFIFLLLFLGISKLKSYMHQGWMGLLEIGLVIAGLIYALLAIKNFYKQGWAKSILKFILFNLLCMIALGILFFLFFALSVFQL